MSARILYGKEFAAKIKESARLGVEELKKDFGITPGLAVVIVGENPASQ
ncbi:MAG: bifunctional 5,10-methylene-tetrahydrofolate dehydrogenase/5,10-methylene-tetrahydrofolate cyclohydrolase, partial [Quinella sp. 1Q5]|nr:bifunctional 5,10-methylene-tetrahydrofolate dehydrogenase/5,10-methylene-tetrahydrofolate cyclohydrolase [Quinella sp. 1Q5]